jgi:hypothetical protein
MNTRSNPPAQFFSKDDLPVRTRKGKKKSTTMAESNPERASSSESEEEEGSVSDMPPPDQEPPKLPDLEVIRNRRSQSRNKSIAKTQTQTEELKASFPTSSWFSSSKPEDTWRDQRADSAQREQRRKEEYWNRESRIPRLRRVKSTSSLNEVSARGLTEIISHITKPIVTLNDKTARNDDRRLERNLMHLNKVTEDRIKSALFEDLHGLTEHIQKLDTQVEHLANIHKLSSRVDTRKANSLSVLEKYPTVDASPTIYRQASSALLNLIKNIVTVKGLTITKDSYSYILEIALSSNVIANQYILSESQQFSLLLDSLPANSSEFAVLNRCANLEDLFETISTFAPSIPTQRELESKIVSWKLDYRSVAHLNKSLTDLIAWVEDVSDSDLRTIDIYHNVIGRILQEKLNSRILHNLQEIRMKISEQDKISDLVQMLLCPLKQLIPKNEHATKNVQKTENVLSNHTSNDIASSPRSIAYLSDPNTLMQVSYYPPGYVPPSVNAVNSNTQEKKVGKYAERNRKKRERKALEKQVNAVTQQRTDQTQQTMSSAPKTTVPATEKPNDLRKLKKFVDPWPENKPYLNKSGNALSAEFEKAFDGFCFKCGHFSHKGQDCRIYPDSTAVLTLCSKCRQGLHDECKSRRKFYPKQNVNQLHYFQRDGFRNFYPSYPMWGGFNNVTMPYGDFGLLGQSERPKLQPIAED